MIQGGDYPAKSNYYSSLGGFGRTVTVPSASSLEECKDTCLKMLECVQATWAPLPWPVKIVRCSVYVTPRHDPANIDCMVTISCGS